MNPAKDYKSGEHGRFVCLKCNQAGIENRDIHTIAHLLERIAENMDELRVGGVRSPKQS